MIIARLTIQESPDGTKALVGRTVCNWPLTVGTPLVLRKAGDEYELLELAPRTGTRDQQAILSFVADDDSEKDTQ